MAMLTTVTLTEIETLKWSSDAELRATLRTYAARAAARYNRRFWQIAAVDGRVLQVGENKQ